MHGLDTLRSVGRGRLIALLIITSLAVFTLAARAFNRAGRDVAVKESSGALVPTQTVSNGSSRFFTRLVHHPETDRMRRRLGLRFFKEGREILSASGALTIGGAQHTLRLSRTFDDDGEQVEIVLDQGRQSFAWNSSDGPKSNGTAAGGPDRALIERLVLDSPDQFILAQLRGASYSTIARNARPADAGGSDDYAGPVWDIVRVSEPGGVGPQKPESASRLYHINSASGLIEKVVSKDQSGTVVAEISGWIDYQGEKLPSRITWSRNRQVLMDVAFTGFALGKKN